MLVVLFVLGMCMGWKRLMIKNLGRLGWEGGILGRLRILGSMVGCLVVFDVFFKKGGKE